MADRANDEILQLASQGNLQALSVYLNRHLIPSGAHVKVKLKDSSLHVLIVFMREAVAQELLNSVQKILTQLKPANIQRVKVYKQVLGNSKASLAHQFILTITSAAPQQAAISNTRPTQQTSPHPAASTAAVSQALSFQPSQPPIPAQSYPSPATTNSPKAEKSRYSVADFLAQATNIQDLQVLHQHPFFTGNCPQCHHEFEQTDTPPLFWDCPNCGWRDDLSASVPTHKIHKHSTQTSLTESKRLGDYLVEAGLLTAAQIEVALADQMTSNLKFGEVLVRRGWIKEETIEYLMAKVIVPERASAAQNSASYLESSRNLLKALLKNPPPLGEATPKLEAVPFRNNQGQPEPQKTKPQPEPEVAQAPAVPKFSGNIRPAHERETLILPDNIDLDDYLSQA